MYSAALTVQDSELAPGALTKLYKVLAWSLSSLAAGIWPACDEEGRKFSPDFHPHRAAMAGRSLADGFRGALLEVRGDWKFLREALCLRLSPKYKTAHPGHPAHSTAAPC